jgi:hypothetical protein
MPTISFATTRFGLVGLAILLLIFTRLSFDTKTVTTN